VCVCVCVFASVYTHTSIKTHRDPQQTHIGIHNSSNVYSDVNPNTLICKYHTKTETQPRTLSHSKGKHKSRRTVRGDPPETGNWIG